MSNVVVQLATHMTLESKTLFFNIEWEEDANFI